MPNAHAQLPEWESLRGRTILDVRVESTDVFDPSRPGQDHFLFSWANALHIVTRPHIVKREFGQDIGDPFDPQRAAECERNLRQLGIFQDVTVSVSPLRDGVEVVLRTADRWSLNTYPVLRSQGGVNQLGLVVGERNLLGLGVELGVAAIYSNDVSEVAFGWRDRRLFGSRWDVGLGLRNDDLGDAQWGGLAHPFYSDEARWSADGVATHEDTERRLFETGTEVARLRIDEEIAEGYAAVHGGEHFLQRLALFHDRRRVTGDVDNKIAAIGLAWSLLRRGFLYQRDLDEMGPREELSQGFTVQIGAGLDLPELGAERQRFLYRADAAWSQALGASALWGAVLRHHAFVGAGPPSDGRLLAETWGFWKQGESSCTLAWRLGADALVGGPRHERFNLGGDDRLRGYEARTLNGTRTLYGSLEERLLTDRRILFLRLGGVVFVDAAAAWDDGEEVNRSHVRLGTGIGLRIGTDPAGHNVSRLDLGFGTNSVALTFASGSFFEVARKLSFPTTRLFR